MWTKPYGTTGKNVSVVSFGGMRFPEPEKIDEMAEIVVHAHQRGINYFDTAPNYCKDKSEDIMGAAFARMDRDAFYCSSKCMAADGDEFRRSLERTLDRLGVEQVDFFHVWCIVRPEQFDERKAGGAVDAALKAKEEGLVGHVVVSSHLNGRDLADLLRDGPFEGVTLGYSAINFPYREKAVEAAGELDLGVVTMNPLAGGLIPDNPDRFSFIQGPEDPSIVAAAVRFNVSHPAITSALVGFSTKAHVDEAVEAVEAFEPYGQDRIDEIREHILGEFEDLCTGCEYCLPCPEGLDVPKLMDAYNSWVLHDRDPKHLLGRLKYHWQIAPDQALQCIECGECEERCTQHLPIRDRLHQIGEAAKQAAAEEA